MSSPPPLPSLRQQVRRLDRLGLLGAAGLTEQEALDLLPADPPPGTLLVLAADVAPASRLAPLLDRDGRGGFVVVDMRADIDRYAPVDGVDVPPTPCYLVHRLDRGDHLANRSPDEAMGSLAADGRTPLTLTEGLHWVLQQPRTLERNHCFMTIGSRLRRPDGRLDPRTPAIWISNGTGRDGAENRDAPKVGWCWAGNRHTWLGFASASGRAAVR